MVQQREFFRYGLDRRPSPFAWRTVVLCNRTLIFYYRRSGQAVLDQFRFIEPRLTFLRALAHFLWFLYLVNRLRQAIPNRLRWQG